MHDSGRILRGAAEVIAAVNSGASVLDEQMEKVDPRYRRSVGHLVFSYYRRRKAIDALLDKYIERPPIPAVMALLQSAVTQLFFQKALAVESAVNIAVSEAKKRKADKFVNAVLRRILREGAHFSDDPEFVLPEPFLRRWKSRPELGQLCEAFLHGGAFTFRLEYDWELEDIQAEAVSSPAFRFFKGKAADVLKSKTFAEHHIYVQDPATSLPFQDLDLSFASRAVDICAAPGGKTLMMAELMPKDSLIIAADRSRNRQQLTRSNLENRKINAQVIVAIPEEIAGEYDAVLADVPCSNTGVFRRRPDALWNFSVAKMKELIDIQAQILESAARLTSTGGVLIYSTCSIEDEENSLQIEKFLKKHPEFALISMRQLIPDKQIDGAFAAVMRKVK